MKLDIKIQIYVKKKKKKNRAYLLRYLFALKNWHNVFDLL